MCAFDKRSGREINMHNKKFTSLFVFAIVVLIVGSGFAYAQKGGRRSAAAAPARSTAPPPAILNNVDTLTMIRRSNRLNVGVASYVPWAMHDKSGKLIGFEIDVAQKLADDLGVELNLMPSGQSSLLDNLLSKRVDILVTGMYPTPQRALLVNFSEPYAKSKIELIASRDKMRDKGDRRHYDDPEVTIGVVSGAVYESIARSEFPKAKIQLFDNEAELMEAVGTGAINAAMASTPGPEFAMKHGGARIYRPLADPIETLDESLAIRKGDVDFLNFLNTWIRYYERNGWLKAKRAYWFENTEWADQL